MRGKMPAVGKRAGKLCGFLLLTLLLTACGSGTANETETEAAVTSGSEADPDNAGDDEEPQSEADDDASQQSDAVTALEGWAEAFASRDGEAIAAMSSQGVTDAFREHGLIIEEDGGFGWSSPWPWGGADDYRITEQTDTTAVILYYAWVSDPHVTVWRETLTYHMEEAGIVVEEEELYMMDAICTGEEYANAYPAGINGTRMDYLYNDAGQALNDNAKGSRDKQSGGPYEKLFEPDTAAVRLLNLLDNPGKVEATVLSDTESGEATVDIHFTEDGSTLQVKMIRPFGEDGIWIPQDFLAEME